MKKLSILGCLTALVLLAAYTGLTLYDDLMPVGRMWETPVIRPHEVPLLPMQAGTVPFSGGEGLFRASIETGLLLPDTLTPANPVAAGEKAYTWYCAPCHGNYLDGMGTVGQSFHPLPRDLKSPNVLEQDNEELFYIISYGMLRMPGLATTVPASDRMAVIHFIRDRAARTGQAATPENTRHGVRAPSPPLAHNNRTPPP